MAGNPHSRVRIDPDNIQPAGLCDRCKQRWNLGELSYQHDWRGTSIQNTHVRVCPNCLDELDYQKKTIVLPPDPEPVLDARPANSIYIDGASDWTLSAAPGTKMFRGIAYLVAALQRGQHITATVSDTSVVDCDLLQQFQFSAAISVLGGVTAAVKFGATTQPEFAGVSAVVSALQRSANISALVQGNGYVGAIPRHGIVTAASVSVLSGISSSLYAVSTAKGYTAGGQDAAVSYYDVIDKFPFASDTNAADVGNLTVARRFSAGQSSSAYGYTAGGRDAVTYSVTIDKFPFASDTNAANVGNLTVARTGVAGQSSSTSGYTAGGADLANYYDVIDKFPFASDTNAADVGNLTVARRYATGQSSSTSGYTAGGGDAVTYYDIIDKFPFASDTNAADVGNLTVGRQGVAGQSSSTYGYTAGGADLANYYDIIDKFPFASDTDAADVGNLTVARRFATGQSSSTSGYTAGGGDAVTYYDIIDKFPFASDTNAADVGNLTVARTGVAGCQSNSIVM